MKYLISMLLLLTVSPNHTSAQKQFSTAQLKEDLLYYKLKLTKHHPNLYLYNSKEKFTSFFDNIYNSISSPMNEAEFYQLITLTSSLVKDGHTLILPSNDFTTYHNANSKFLPLQIGVQNNSLHIKMNGTHTKLFEEGTLIDSINGVSSADIIDRLLKRQVRDGENLSYAKWILDTYFREYYSYVLGHADTFRIAFKKENQTYCILLPALKKDSIYFYRQKNYPQFYPEQDSAKGITLTYHQSKQVAVLNIKSFDTDILKNNYKQTFDIEIKKIIDEIIKTEIPHLILDLRNNQGGDVENGVLLLQYLIAKPFKIVNEYQRLKNGNLRTGNGPSMGIHQPNNKLYKGQVYVLLNGGSFSNSIILSSCLRENSNAIFAGTESGGNPYVLAGYAKDFELPNTKMNVQIPVLRFILTSIEKNKGAGLIPTYKIENSIEDILLQKDSQLDFLLHLIQQNKR
jgi:hypothetical protein